MKKLISLIILFMMANVVFAEDIELDDSVKKGAIKMTPKVTRDEKSLTLDQDTAVKGVLSLQQQKDLEDIEGLWKATVDSNNIIKFAMKKLSIPPEQQRVHSSIMAKSVSALVSGASFIPAMFGSNYMTQSAAYATGRLATNYITKKNGPTETPLTDTELIELAGMIETLQDTIINSYYNYKFVLGQIKETRQQLVLSNKNYSEALKRKDDMEILVSSAMYDDLLYEEYRLIQEAKKYHMDLQRLAGKKAVENLNLYQYAFKDELFSPSKQTAAATVENKAPAKKPEIKPEIKPVATMAKPQTPAQPAATKPATTAATTKPATSTTAKPAATPTAKPATSATTKPAVTPAVKETPKAAVKEVKKETPKAQAQVPASPAVSAPVQTVQEKPKELAPAYVPSDAFNAAKPKAPVPGGGR